MHLAALWMMVDTQEWEQGNKLFGDCSSPRRAFVELFFIIGDMFLQKDMLYPQMLEAIYKIPDLMNTLLSGIEAVPGIMANTPIS